MQLDRSGPFGPTRPLSHAGQQRRHAGVATVEAVIMLPALGILLVGMLFVHQLYSAQQRALVVARRCAFEYAVNGCQTVPDSCQDVPLTSQDESGKQRSQAIVSDARARVAGAFDVFSNVPVIGAAIDGIFGTTARASAPIAVRMPWTDTGSVRGSVQISLACNEHNHDNLVKEIEHVFCDYLPALSCGAGPP
jgi:hypothetical protein